MEEMDKKITEVFRKNKIGVKVYGRLEGCSRIEYVLKRLTKEKIDNRKLLRVKDDLTAELSHVPEIYTNPLSSDISVIVRNPEPETVKFSERYDFLDEVDEEILGDMSFPFFLGCSAVEKEARMYDLAEYPVIAIFGDDGYGKTNALKVILDSFREREDFSFTVADLSSKNEYDERARGDSRFTLIKSKEDTISALKTLEDEIKRREDERKKHADTPDPLLFIIDDYSSLMTTQDEEMKMVKTVQKVFKKGFRNNVFLILSAPEMPYIFKDNYSELFFAIIAFKHESFDGDEFPLPNYYPGDAVFYDVDFDGNDSVQCFIADGLEENDG